MNIEKIIAEIIKIQQTFIRLQASNDNDSLNEANTSSDLVEPFLELLGFKKEWLVRQSQVVKGKAIVDIKIQKDGRDIFYVEVKKASSNKIDTKDLFQITSYLNSKNIEWGMLTNGKEYLLVNNEIKGEYGDKEVQRFHIFNDFNFDDFSCFTYQSLFVSKLSNYKKVLKQYQIFKLKENSNYNSWTRYNETLEKYFHYLSKKEQRYKEIKNLGLDEFEEFNKYDILASEKNKDRKNITSIETIKNRYRHIKNFYDLFVKNNLLTAHPFVNNFTNEELVSIYNLSFADDAIQLTIEEILSILDGYDSQRISERNKIMFLLCLYCGLNREQLANIKLSEIDFDSRTIKVDYKIFVFPEELMKVIEHYINEVRDKEFNSDYLFARKYAGYTEQPISTSSINEIIKRASDALPLTSARKKVQINPEKIKGMLANKLFEFGFSVEEIIYITGITLISLSKYISTESILERTDVKNLDNRHPYIEVFRKLQL